MSFALRQAQGNPEFIEWVGFWIFNLSMLLYLLFAAAIIAGGIGLFLFSRWDRRFLLERSLHYQLLRISLPRVFEREDIGKEREKIAVMEQVFSALHHIHERGMHTWFVGQPYLALEVALPNIGEELAFYLAAPHAWIPAIEKAIHAVYPTAEVERVEDYNIFHPRGAHAAANAKLLRDAALPLKTYLQLESDPLRALTGALSKLETEGEGAAIQLVVRPAGKHKALHGRRVARQMQKAGHSFERARFEVSLWGYIASMLRGGKTSAKSYQMMPQPREGTPEARRRAATPYFQESFQPVTPLIQETVKALEQKASKPLFEANLRIITSAPHQARAEEMLEQLETSFSQYHSPQLNGFRFFNLRGRALRDLIYRYSFRTFYAPASFLCNTEELTSLFHLPNVALETPKMKFVKAKPASPPPNLPTEGIEFGVNIFRGAETVVRLAPEDRRRHAYVVGQTGTGKATFLRNLIAQDFAHGRGVGVIDPHGDLAEAVLGLVPPERAEDVVYFDPADMEQPMGLNMLEWRGVEQKDFAVQEMIAIFMKLFPPEVIGPMFEHNMRNAMLTLMADQENVGTIVEIPRIFTDDAYVRGLLPKVTDPIVRAFWEKEMAKTTEFHKSEMLGYLISKVGRFVENEMMRNIIGQQHSGFNLRDIMDSGKIFIANLSKGRVGEVNSSLLGLILVAKMQMAAMGRADMPEEDRRDFYLYIDEFQNFTTDSIATILSEARKYKLNMILAHQFIAQLPDSIREAVFGNIGSLISFRVGPKDAEFLVKQFSPVFTEDDLVNIENFNAYVRLLVSGRVERPFNIHIAKPSVGNLVRARSLKELSRVRFGRPRAAVAADILNRSHLAQGPETHATFVPGERNR